MFDVEHLNLRPTFNRRPRWRQLSVEIIHFPIKLATFQRNLALTQEMFLRELLRSIKILQGSIDTGQLQAAFSIRAATEGCKLVRLTLLSETSILICSDDTLLSRYPMR